MAESSETRDGMQASVEYRNVGTLRLVSASLLRWAKAVDRRGFLKAFSAGTVAAMSGQMVWRVSERSISASPAVFEDIPADPVEFAASIRYMTTPPPDSGAYLEAFRGGNAIVHRRADDLNDYLRKMHNFEAEHRDDVYLQQERYPLLISTFKRLDRVQNLVGYGNFNVLSFDDMLKYSKRYDSVGAFSDQEVDFLEGLFAEDAHRYGFYGEKVIDKLTAVIPSRETIKVPHTGHFLYRGDSQRLYKKVREDVGDNVVLTSGIRGIVKQTHLFLAKTIQSKGNLSRASRSLAPPGHSFHGIGDFDVGKVGFGARNFTSEFARTDEFKRLVDLGYVNMRYPQNNLLGVRFEPWHIKVV